ncbi:helicase-related protein [Paenibacillus turicensis]|uniref:DEAD/DEAH box helicase n=1 Tax=Paenibacillus turicensis TaxID=160487 RepID=UPI003D268A7A
MRVALYAIRRLDSMTDNAMSSSNHASKIIDKWELFVSLNICMDILWWSHWEQWNQKDERDKKDEEQYKKDLEHPGHPQDQQLDQYQYATCDQKNNFKFAPPAAMLLLSSDLPLGWAVMLRDNFICQSQMDHWTSSAWLKYLNVQLSPLMKEEGVALKQQFGSNSNSNSNSKSNSSRFDRRGARGNGNVGFTSDATYRLHMPMWLWSLNQGLTIQGRAMVSEITVYKSDALENGLSDLEMQDEYFPHLLLEDGRLNATVAGYIETGSDRLSNLLAGRSLLEQELLVLLEGSDESNKHLPQETYIQSHVKHQINSQGLNLHYEGGAMPLRGAWRLMVQHAQLCGRVVLTSAVAVAHSRHGGASDHDAAPAYRRLPRLRRAALLKWAARRKLVYRCRRCGSGVHVRTPCGSCGSLCCAYCEACLTLGRSRACALLVQGSAHEVAVPMVAQPEPCPTPSVLDRWGLSPAQRAAAGAALDFLQGAPHVTRVGRSHCLRFSLPHLANAPKSLSHPQQSQQPNRFLLWAVTGAGKTEMIFPLLAYVLEQGGKALVATPRRDVVLELAPRLKVAFPQAQIATLYGGSSERFKQGNLVIATTHQLMRFSHCFDLVVIDELDAFPYHNDPMLAYAAAQCCKPNGKYILLSATPPITLQKEVQKGVLPHAKVPARFHGHPLPVPKHIGMKGVTVALRTKQLPSALISSLHKSVQRGAQIFIFVARIRHISPLITVLKRYFPTLAIEGTSSEDVDRAEKVLRFRSCDIRMLVTTTILERGVTVKKSDVYILDADSDLFDEASLVQMAGRAGRSSDDPAGLVIFSSLDWTTSQRKAIAQIKQMNTLAGKRGYLK